MSNIPKLRFPEFTDAWEKCKLGKIAIKVTEKNKDGIFQETLTNSAEFGVISQRDFFDKDISNPENLNGYYIVKPNDFVYNPRISNLAPVGPIKRNQLNRIGIMSPLYFIFRVSSNIDLDFLDAFFSTNLWHLFLKLNGDSGARADRIAIKDKIFMEMPISIPTLPEQQKIGNLFKQLDWLITLHKRKWDDVILLKKALLQKMFPKNGSDFPEIRFPEFTDAWEKCKLGEVGKTYTGLSGKTKEDFGHGQAKFITYMNVFGNPIASSSGVDRIEIDSRQNEVKFGDVFFTTSSETPEEVGMSSIWLENTENVYLNSFCFGYRPIKIFDPYFFAFYLRSPSIRAKIILLAQGISRYNISKTKMMEQEISIPTLPEQQKIGNLFKQLDRLITLHKRQHEHYQLLKKALLQQMFV
ncbi:EcoKI restriction-modification system protein HsdS [Avibacterium gallinarum]|uniref:EcoKI restriction-modification system protein HsdS n=2 Tax=Avibacterium gallinarum TaxID=755 RepID=A0A379BWW6_AVIGA|nr:restriction endonuclease subunit S [Avibacterium gallinarum]SUB54115.1 EcoKI restriction-modification system protein HsdS [Avibacterium gallinarum]